MTDGTNFTTKEVVIEIRDSLNKHIEKQDEQEKLFWERQFLVDKEQNKSIDNLERYKNSLSSYIKTFGWLVSGGAVIAGLILGVLEVFNK